MEPHPEAAFLDRSSYQRVLDVYGDLLDNVFAYGTHLFIHLVSEKIVPNTRLTIALVLRHLVEQLDGAAALVRVGRTEPTKIAVRAAFEASLNLRYMIEGDTERRALCYRLANLRRRLDNIERHDPNTDIGRAAKEAFDKDTSEFKIEPFDSTKAAAEIREKIALPVFEEAEEDWQARRRKRAKPKWYALFDGPQNLEALATHLGTGQQYQLLYRDWSGVAHAEALFEHVKIEEGSPRAKIPGMRDPESLQPVVAMAASTGIVSYRLVVEGVVPEEMPRFFQFYREVRESYIRVSSSEPLIRNGGESERGTE